MKRPDNRVIDGLKSIATQIDAGACDDFMGYSEDVLDADQRETWRNVCAAIEWIWTLPATAKAKSNTKGIL